MVYTIKDVCKQMDMTSRTLRYYEEEGLVTSIQENENAPRKYTAEQLERIRKIKILRSLSFSIKDIREIFESDKDIMTAIKDKSNILADELVKHEKKMIYIETALTRIQEGKNIFEESFFETTDLEKEQSEVARKVIDLFVKGNIAHVKDYFAKHIRVYIDDKLLTTVWQEKLKEYGNLKKIVKIEVINNTAYITIEMEKMNITVIFYFIDEYLCGFSFGSIGYQLGELNDEKK